MSINAGSYSPFTSNIDQEAAAAFEQALKPLLGVKYEPVAVSQQVVAGLNYAFFCNATVVVPNAPTYPAMVSIFRDLEGNATVTHIQRLDF